MRTERITAQDLLHLQDQTGKPFLMTVWSVASHTRVPVGGPGSSQSFQEAQNPHQGLLIALPARQDGHSLGLIT